MSDNVARCPRCGGDFHCGAADPSAPCDCKSITLDAQTLASLRERYVSCLCVACLSDIQRGSSPAAPPNA